MNVPNNRVDSVWRHYRDRLEAGANAVEASTVIGWLFEDLFGIDRSALMLNPERLLSESELLKLHFAVERVEQGEPVQYITGKAEFMGRYFEVNPAVLIPRPETEELVRWISEDLPHEARVLDIGTGSGIIPISLKLNHPKLQVAALDVSEEALAVARRNGETLQAEVNWMQLDMLSQAPRGEVDIVVSNPPYVLASEAQEMQVQVVEHEPGLALFVPDADPLIFYERIIKWGAENLKSGAVVYFEIHEHYGQEIIAIFDSYGFVNMKLRRDLNGKDRMLRGYRP